jgi:exopolysaccharide biosynthesis polyprenyl glycosylphosphotransferase
MRLAFLEASLAFAAACASVLVCARMDCTTWTGALTAAGWAVGPSVCLFLAFSWNDLYDPRRVRDLRHFAERLPLAISLGLALLVGLYAVFPEAKMGPKTFLASLLSVLGVLLSLRALAYRVMRSRSFSEKVLVLGTGRLARQLVAEIESRPELSWRIVGVVADEEPEAAALQAPLVGRLEELGRIVDSLRPDRIVVALQTRRGRLPVQRLLELRVRGIVVEDATQVYESLSGKLAIEALPPSSLVFSRDFRAGRFQRAAARLASIVAAAVGLVLSAPLLLLIGIAIRLDSPGPVFFHHERVGARGRRFRLIKFRTMHPAPGPTSEWERDNGDRITRLGRVLRRFRLDELPQFLNVLRGDMNLVGPRPHPVANFELFAARIPYYSLRSAIRPGITGWAQVRYGYANNLEEETEKMRYDLYYIKHMSLWLDLRIVLETVKTVLSGREHEPVPGWSPLQATLGTR